MSILTRFLNLFRTRAMERDFDDELSFHMDRSVERHMQDGMNQADAEAAAGQELGSVTRAKRAMREVRVMKTSMSIAVAAGVALSLAAATWLWFRTGQSAPRAPAYYQTTDQGVTAPAVVYEQKPTYPEAAKQAKVQGTVLLQCIVQTSGVCDDVRITRPLDAMWLDEEAISALRLWRFRPGTRMGEPVPVQVNVEFRFTVRER
jgi:TonB family protein